MTPKSYTDNFYSAHLKHSLSSAENVLPFVQTYINPESVIDVGCGVGTWLSVWEKMGVVDVIGVDGDYVALEELLISREKFVPFNLEMGYTSDRKYDLIMCLEVAEHLSAGVAKSFVSSLCALSDIVLFSAAIPGQEGTLHINEQYPEYWAKLFLDHDYLPIDIIRKRVWHNREISWWYRQNLLFFMKRGLIDKNEVWSKDASNTDATHLTMVHPELLEYKTGKALKLEQGLLNCEAILNNPYKLTKRLIKNFITSKKTYERERH